MMWFSQQLRILTAGLLFALAIAGPAHAGLVSINNAALSSNGAEITLNAGETVVFGWNVNGNAVSAPVINGITFSNTQPGSVAFAGFPALVADDPTTGAHYTGPMVELMNDLVGTNANSAGTFTVNGLTVGALYRLQFLSLQDVNNDAIRQFQVFYGTTSGTSSGAFATGNDIGRIVTATFIADATSQLFTFSPGSDDRAILNGAALVQVPEPGSALLVVGVLVGLLIFRRR